MSVCERLAELARTLPDEHTAALITSPVNRRYLCGYGCEEGMVLLTKSECLYIVGSLYFEQARALAQGCTVMLMDDPAADLLDLLFGHDIRCIAAEAQDITEEKLSALRRALNYTDVRASDSLSETLSSMRMIKSREEAELITAAQNIADRAFERLLGRLRKGMTERRIAAMLSCSLLECGAEDTAGRVIAASGKNSACPCAFPTDREISDGDFLVLDFGAKFGGYCARMARTLAVGRISHAQEEAYNAVFCAGHDALGAIRAGVNAKVADSVARSTLNAWGADKYFTHGLGCGIGMEPCEKPVLSKKSGAMLRAGMVVSVGPAVYLPEMYGVRIKNMAQVTENGCNILTNTTSNLIRI